LTTTTKQRQLTISSINLDQYLAKRARHNNPARRPTCAKCWKCLPTCYCAELKPFVSPLSFVIVQHLDEARNPIATARMAHLSILNSKLIMDKDFPANNEVDALLKNPGVENVMLYPGIDADSLESLLNKPTESSTRPPVFWILDTTWSHTSKMLRLSPSLKAMRKIKFEPDMSSQFQVRRQPNPKCLSTIESIYLVIERWRKLHDQNFADHQSLLKVFQYMVNQQLEFSRVEKNRMKGISHETTTSKPSLPVVSYLGL
jgi:DTW domain-containing protein YfiP